MDKYTQAPLQGATIRLVGEDNGAITDSMGNFKLETSLGVKNVTITYSGY